MVDIKEIDREKAAKAAHQVCDAIVCLDDCIGKLQQVSPEIPGQQLAVTDTLYRFVDLKRSLQRVFNL